MERGNQGPAFVRDSFGAHPRFIPELGYDFRVNLHQSDCFLPLDVLRSNDPLNRPPNNNFGDLAWVGYDQTISKRCGDVVDKFNYDFDGDVLSDPVVFRPSNPRYYLRRSSLGLTFSRSRVINEHSYSWGL